MKTQHISDLSAKTLAEVTFILMTFVPITILLIYTNYKQNFCLEKIIKTCLTTALELRKYSKATFVTMTFALSPINLTRLCFSF